MLKRTSTCANSVLVLTTSVNNSATKYTTNLQQIESCSPYSKSATDSQQADSLRQIHNISTCRDVVQQIDVYNKSTTKSTTNQTAVQQVRNIQQNPTNCCTTNAQLIEQVEFGVKDTPVVTAPGRDAKCCDERVCMSVCFSAETSRNFLCVFPVAVDRFSSDDSALSYVLPVS